MSNAFELTDDHLTIKSITITNTDAIAFLRQIPDGERESTIAKAIEVGLFCLERGRNTQDIDFVKRQVQELLHKVETAIADIPGRTETALLGKIGSENGQVLAPVKSMVDTSAAALTSRIDDVKRLLANDLDPKSATSSLGLALQTVKTLLDPKHQDSVQFRLSTAVSSIADTDGALAMTMRKCVEDSIKPLKDELDGLSKQIKGEEMVLEALSATTGKGKTFEEEVAETLAAWARFSGGQVSRVGEDNKPGDFTVDFRDDASGSHLLRVVVEARDRQNGVGRQRLSQDLAPKFRQRNAHAAIHVSKTIAGLALEIGDWAEGHCEGGHWVACTHNHLTLALRFVVVEHKIRRLRESRPDIDSSVIQAQVQAIRTALGRVKTIKTKVTNLRSTTTDIETEADNLRTEINSALGALEETLRQQKKDVASSETSSTDGESLASAASF